MNKLLWTPSEKRKEQANITKFIKFVNEKYSLAIESYDVLYDWSVNNIADFWASIWDFIPIIASRKYDEVIDDLTKFPGAKWFEGAGLNFAENLLRYRDDRTAFIFAGQNLKSKRMTYSELYYSVARLAKSLRAIGTKPGDRVVAYMPNLIETAIAMLAATSIGAAWSSCATDLGAQAAVDRLGQIEPKVLFTVDGYYYKEKTFSSLANVNQIARGIPSLEKIIIARYIEEESNISHIPNSVFYDQFMDKEEKPEIDFEHLPFSHPVFIMFSSGTTGKPKCIVQGAGGVLINHLLELILQTDLKREDIIFYVTTCSWMMWNWLISSLGVGATILLYDGNPNYPDAGTMWQLIQDNKVTIFGTSASYINYVKNVGLKPGNNYDLSSLREICQTGSPLSAGGFEYVYQNVKRDLHFNSISGGTDINGCFAIGSPTVPVYAGELQRWGLGKKMNCYDEKGKPVLNQMGELVCEAPIPSMPLYFWNDPNGERYRDSYFNFYPGVWRHGDYVMINSDTKGITFYGRSDALLKPSGVRIGTAEIYNQLDKLEEVADSLAIGQEWKGDQRIILFVKLASRFHLTEDLVNKIKRILRENASPRHVPARIVEVPDIPYTFNMKKVETAVTNIIHGRPVSNRDALVNPQSLNYYESIIHELQRE
jgi:acetoacetyl-CoA synthetase